MNTANGVWSAHLFVDCPYCEKQNDVLDDVDTVEYLEFCQSQQNVGLEIVCKHCKGTFMLKDTEW